MTEHERVTKIKAGDRCAFKQLFEDYQHLVYTVSYRMSGNREEAEDITQDVFLIIFQAIKTFRGDAKLSSWIYRITVNTCLKRARRKKIEQVISLEFLYRKERNFQPLSPDATPEHYTETVEKEKIVQQAIQSLPERQKTALILHRYENLSYQEISKIMQTSLSAIESLLHRARENLAKKLLSYKKQL
jgi:RNA polymerase sigma-70 factor, ECF subfamily